MSVAVRKTIIFYRGAFAQKTMRLMIIDDDKALLDLSVKISLKLGHEAIGYDSAKGGLFALGSYSPDVILTDMIMPGMDGLDFIKAYLEDHFEKVKSPVELITGYGDPVRMEEFYVLANKIYEKLNIGVGFRHIAKPFRISELNDRLSLLEDALRFS